MTQGATWWTRAFAPAARSKSPARPSASPSRSSTTSPRAVTGSPADLAVIISGPDLGALRAPGRPDARPSCAQCRARPTRSIEQEADRRNCASQIDRQRVARYGINVRDVQDVIEMAIGGTPISTRLRGRAALRHHGALRRARRAPIAGAIGNILVPTRDGGRGAAVPAGATSRSSNGASIIARRENQPPDLRAHQHPRPRPGQLRRARRRSGSRAAVKLPAGLRRGLGRPVRKPRARAEAARVHPADHHRHHLRPAVLRRSAPRSTRGWCC